MAERKETAGDIEVKVSPNETVTVESLTMNEEYDIELIYGSGMQFPSGYAIKQASFQGSMTIQGNKKDLKDHFFDSVTGMPKVCDSVTVNHLETEDDSARDSTSYNEVLVTNKGYEVNDGEVTETTYEFVAMQIDD